MTTESSDEILRLVAQTLGQVNENMTGVNKAIINQNEAITHQPTTRDVLNINFIASVIVIVGIIVATGFSVNAAKATGKIGDQNNATVSVYCGAQPELPECTTQGSATAKAAAILANCAVYRNLLAATPVERRKPLVTDVGCRALGFVLPAGE